MISAQQRSENESGGRVTGSEQSQSITRSIWETSPRLSPAQGRWLDEFRKFRGVELAKMYGGGLWILSSNGAPVYAVESGVTLFAGHVRGWGEVVLIQHNYGYLSVYGNLNELFVRRGDKVEMQEKLGSVGNAMRREGLYFELRRGGETVHPSRWISQNESTKRRQ